MQNLLINVYNFDKIKAFSVLCDEIDNDILGRRKVFYEKQNN